MTTQYWSRKHLQLDRRWERPYSSNTTSLGCNRCGRGGEGHPHAKKRPASVIGTNRREIAWCSRIFQKKSPNCGVCRMTKTARTRCEKKRRWNPTRNRLGQLITADHRIMNIDNEPRNDFRNAHIVQDGFSYWLQSSPTRSTDEKSQHLVRGRRFLTTVPELGQDLHRQIQRSSSQRVRVCTASALHHSKTNGTAERTV